DVQGQRGPQGLAEVRDDAADRVATRDGDPIPSSFAVVRELVPGPAKRVGRRVGIGELRLLHQQDVRPRTLEPPENLVEPGLQRVDVPGGDPHGRSLVDIACRRTVRRSMSVTGRAASSDVDPSDPEGPPYESRAR